MKQSGWKTWKIVKFELGFEMHFKCAGNQNIPIKKIFFKAVSQFSESCVIFPVNIVHGKIEIN